jgi:hypothetical protein
MALILRKKENLASKKESSEILVVRGWEDAIEWVKREDGILFGDCVKRPRMATCLRAVMKPGKDRGPKGIRVNRVEGVRSERVKEWLNCAGLRECDVLGEWLTNHSIRMRMRDGRDMWLFESNLALKSGELEEKGRGEGKKVLCGSWVGMRSRSVVREYCGIEEVRLVEEED